MKKRGPLLGSSHHLLAQIILSLCSEGETAPTAASLDAQGVCTTLRFYLGLLITHCSLISGSKKGNLASQTLVEGPSGECGWTDLKPKMHGGKGRPNTDPDTALWEPKSNGAEVS